MSLRTQIELMTVPQEFTRLCNAVLIAEYGDDFLPIDDDRADRGNDGYLKSEKRMFAGHCFKRVQNQVIDKLVRAKMIGDLGKAIALKHADVWQVDAWTFLSNYPISEHVAAEVWQIGRGLDADPAAALLRAMRHQPHDIGNECCEIDLDLLKHKASRLDAREIENVVDQGQEMLSGRMDHLGIFVMLLRIVREGAGFDQF